MTYASQQLAEALQELVREAEIPHYSQRQLPASIEINGIQFPQTVAEFLNKTSHYAEQTKAVSIGIY